MQDNVACLGLLAGYSRMTSIKWLVVTGLSARSWLIIGWGMLGLLNKASQPLAYRLSNSFKYNKSTNPSEVQHESKHICQCPTCQIKLCRQPSFKTSRCQLLLEDLKGNTAKEHIYRNGKNLWHFSSLSQLLTSNMMNLSILWLYFLFSSPLSSPSSYISLSNSKCVNFLF